MSDVKRWEFGTLAILSRGSFGTFVRSHDYDALATRVAALEAECAALRERVEAGDEAFLQLFAFTYFTPDRKAARQNLLNRVNAELARRRAEKGGSDAKPD